MHQAVRDNLEEYLRGVGGKFARAVPPEMEAHLDSCRACAEELNELERHSLAVRSLRAPELREPRAGFYVRVMQRIDEARAANSVWAAFLDPTFARGLVYATVALVLLFGTYLVSTEPRDPALTPAPIAVQTPVHDAVATADDDLDNGTTAQERDAVLVDLASYHQ